jgi:hypothetical protein
VLQRGGRGVRRGRARRLRHSETLLLRQRRACRSASRRQDAARAGRSGCAGSTRTAPSVGLPSGARPHQQQVLAPRHMRARGCARTWPRARAAPLARPPRRRPARAEAATHVAPLARLGQRPRSPARPTQSGPPQTLGHGLGAPVQGSHGPQVPHSAAAAGHVRSRAAARPAPRQRLPPAGPGGPAMRAQSRAQRRAAPTRGRARGGRKHARPPGDANPRRAPRGPGRPFGPRPHRGRALPLGARRAALAIRTHRARSGRRLGQPHPGARALLSCPAAFER